MKILSYQKKERGGMLGVLEVELLLDYGAGPQPAMVRLKHFKSQKNGREFVCMPSEKNWDSPEQKYEDVVKLLSEGSHFKFSDAVMALLNDFPKNDLPDVVVDDEDLPF